MVFWRENDFGKLAGTPADVQTPPCGCLPMNSGCAS
jgi:hypothetical protein